MRAALLRRTQDRTPVTCLTCAAPYRPSLTGWSCPVCDTPAPGAEERRGRGLTDDDRLLAIVAFATIANVVLLGLLAVFVLGVS